MVSFRTPLNVLFTAVDITISSWFASQNKKEKFKPGFILTLPTFGRNLKWNPHIHAIITEGASGNVLHGKSLIISLLSILDLYHNKVSLFQPYLDFYSSA